MFVVVGWLCVRGCLVAFLVSRFQQHQKIRSEVQIRLPLKTCGLNSALGRWQFETDFRNLNSNSLSISVLPPIVILIRKTVVYVISFYVNLSFRKYIFSLVTNQRGVQSGLLGCFVDLFI